MTSQRPRATFHGSCAGRRRGGAYLVVLGVSMIVAAFAYGALLVTRAKGRTAMELSDAALARQYARDAIELGRVWINQDANWRTNRTVGVWASNQTIGSGTFTLEASEPIDGDLANWPHDPVVLKATGRKGNATHILQVTLLADPKPIQALQFAVHTQGELHITGGKTLDVTGGTVSTNTELKNDGTILGSIDVGSTNPLGTVTGTQIIGGPAKAIPASTIIDNYIALGTVINPGSTMEKKVLGPGVNPYGVPNPYGIYVINSGNDVTVKNCRVFGTLVVVCPGKKLKTDNSILLQPCRNDMPALLVKGQAEFSHSGGLLGLSETTSLVNFNPAGAPYAGSSDNDVLDAYPSEIQGFVHVTQQVDWKQSAHIRGALCCNSGASSDAVKVHDNPKVTYTSSLLTTPPAWYTTRVDMPVQPGSWRQLAN